MRIPLPALLILTSSVGAAQVPSTPSFEVASIHAADPGPGISSIGTSPGAFNMRHITLLRCIEWAYNLKLTGPGWLDDVKFDIAARAGDRTANDDQLHLMVQTLLAERFSLKLHREHRVQPVYTLSLSKSGPKFHEAGTMNASRFEQSTSREPNSFSENETSFTAQRVSMSDLASKLSQPLGRVVVDKTGLQGRYDLRIDTTQYPDERKAGSREDLINVLLTSFRDQLGLELEAGHEAIDVLVVDSVNKTPTEN